MGRGIDSAWRREGRFRRADVTFDSYKLLTGVFQAFVEGKDCRMGSGMGFEEKILAIKNGMGGLHWWCSG